MPSICFYFQVHQPFRLKKYSFFDIGNDPFYEDELKNIEILNKVAEKCYLPTNAKILELIKRHKGKFRVSYSISGVFIEQCEKYRPDILESFVELSKTNCVEFISETYYHSLSFLFSREEFKRQVQKHKEKIQQYFGQTPRIFRNTELIFNNELASFIEDQGFKGIICEGVDRHLGYRSPNYLYTPVGCTTIKALLKNYRLSDDIAFRFSDKNWKEWPLTTDKFAHWAHAVAGNGEVINLFMDYETFGEHQWESTGIFNFLDHLPDAIFRHPDFSFRTPSEVVDIYPSRGEYDIHNYISWADTERDLSAWLSNSMQHEAMQRVFSLEQKVKALDREELTHTWAKLQTSDHFYYMCTKYWSDGDVHKYFSPYDSPYDAYIYYVNALNDFELRLREFAESGRKPKKESRRKQQVALELA